MTAHNIAEIQAGLDPRNIIESNKHQEYRPGKLIRCPIPSHEDKNPSCSYNEIRQIWHCFVCQEAGTLIDILGYGRFPDYDHKTRPHLMKLIDEASGIGIIPRRILPSQPDRPVQLTADLNRYASHLSDWTYNLRDDVQLMNWLDDRGITESSLWKFSLGLSDAQSELYPSYIDRLIIPNFYRGVLVGIKYRSRPGKPKEYKHFKDSTASIPFNANAITQRHDVVLLVESELDAIALSEVYGSGVVCVSIPAGGFSRAHAGLFSLTKSLIVIGDNDEAGFDSAARLRGMFRRGHCVFPPSNYKDVGEVIQAGASLDWITGAIRLARERG